MEEIKLKRLTLLILKSIVFQEERTVDENFAIDFNYFIYNYYEENKELFSLIYNPSQLEEFIKNNYEVLSLEQIIILIKRYYGFLGYNKLVKEVGPEIDDKVERLALLFTKHYYEFLNLQDVDPMEYYPKGYPRILE